MLLVVDTNILVNAIKSPGINKYGWQYYSVKVSETVY